VKNNTFKYLTMSKFIVYRLFELIAMINRGKMDEKSVKDKIVMTIYISHAEVFACPHAKQKTNVSFLIIAFLLRHLQVHLNSSLSLYF